MSFSDSATLERNCDIDESKISTSWHISTG